MRVVHLLEHTAGFDNMGLNHMYNNTATDPRGPAVLAIFRKEPRCRWRPSEHARYTNPGYQVASYLLEKFSGQPYEQYLTEHLLRPLAMPDTTPALRISTGPGMSRGYLYGNGRHQSLPLEQISSQCTLIAGLAPPSPFWIGVWGVRQTRERAVYTDLETALMPIYLGPAGSIERLGG